ncbi:MAG: ATP-binding protein, partial [Chloroflexi bacterium]|nr:ATP-binding protein [Chloroflexota bacterium]
MLKPWYNVAVPHRDIREGRMDESVFAASLSDVAAGRGALEYLDAATFFQKTYPTQGLLNLLGAVVGRLAGTGYGEPVIQLQTPFGGGKTHVLVALYHLLRSPEALAGADMIQQILERSGAGALPKGRVVVFDGTAADPVKGKTPWGEIAAQLGRYELLREQDQARRAPGKDRLHEVLAGGPVLILMDEVAEYAVKARDFRDQVMAFFQELTETVKVAERCALVVTLPSSAPYGEEGEHVLAQLQQIIGRVEALYAPVEGDEVFEVIRRRLFESVGTPREAQQVAEAYWQLYQRLGEDVPAEARNPAYRERLRRAYPFHPQVIDLLYERWSTFPTFQRTRGVLRLLAHVVLDLYRSKRHAAPLIQAAHLNLANSAIRREFVKHIGNEFEGVIAADIVDSNAKA